MKERGESKEGCVSGLDILIKKIMDTPESSYIPFFSPQAFIQLPQQHQTLSNPQDP